MPSWLLYFPHKLNLVSHTVCSGRCLLNMKLTNPGIV